MIGDWPVGLGILVVVVLWIQIFSDYRRKLGKIMPSVSQVSTRRNEISKEINSGESTLQSIQGQMTAAHKELEELEEKRIELQERLNPLEMVAIPAGRLRMGTNTPGREDENPEHLVALKPYYIDKYEVTNLQYKEFVQVTGHRSPTRGWPIIPSSMSHGMMPRRIATGSANVCHPRQSGSGRPRRRSQ